MWPMWCAKSLVDAMKSWFVASLAWCLLLPTAQAVTVSLTPSDALRCMTPPEAERGTPEYPKESFERKEGGTVDVELTFTDPASAPRVSVADDSHRTLTDAVRRHVRKYRVPCLAQGQTATLKQSFLFTPTDGRQVAWTKPRDADDKRRSELMRCITNASGKAPHYPTGALAREEQGAVLLGLTYKDGVGPPEVEVLDDTPHRHLIEVSKQHAQGYRLPCHVGEPLRTTHAYIFRIEGGSRMVVNDSTLVSYLRSVKDIQNAKVYFDFNEMKCPFDTRIQMNQPVEDNLVGEVGETVPDRRFFLDWLSRQRLNFDKTTQNRIYGQLVTVSIPCGVLSLGNQPGGGAGQ
jgi:hypothetical protein